MEQIEDRCQQNAKQEHLNLFKKEDKDAEFCRKVYVEDFDCRG